MFPFPTLPFPTQRQVGDSRGIMQGEGSTDWRKACSFGRLRPGNRLLPGRKRHFVDGSIVDADILGPIDPRKTGHCAPCQGADLQ